MNQEKFNLQIVHENFKNSILVDNDNVDDVHMDSYLEGFKELYKFFHLMGSVFSFVSSDVKSKIEILEDFRRKENGDKFISFDSMLNYEKSTGLLIKSDYVSGSRTLLRLHRGLDFIKEFLFKLGELKSTDKTQTACQISYNETLAQFHPWIIRKAAVVAMYALPTREQLLNKVCVDIDEAINILPHMLEITKNVYDRTQSLYTLYELHELP